MLGKVEEGGEEGGEGRHMEQYLGNSELLG